MKFFKVPYTIAFKEHLHLEFSVNEIRSIEFDGFVEVGLRQRILHLCKTFSASESPRIFKLSSLFLQIPLI
jgi:hypothetical protein